MLPKHSLVYALLPGLSIANCMTQQQQMLGPFKAPLTGENGLAIVPLNETATTGIVPPADEQAILRCECSPYVLFLLLCTHISF